MDLEDSTKIIVDKKDHLETVIERKESFPTEAVPFPWAYIRLHYKWTVEDTNPKLTSIEPEIAGSRFEIRNAKMGAMHISLPEDITYDRESFDAKIPYSCIVIYKVRK